MKHTTRNGTPFVAAKQSIRVVQSWIGRHWMRYVRGLLGPTTNRPIQVSVYTAKISSLNGQSLMNQTY